MGGIRRVARGERKWRWGECRDGVEVVRRSVKIGIMDFDVY